MKKFTYLFIYSFTHLLICSFATAAPGIEYTIAMPEPHTHYFEVQMKVTDFSQPYVDFKMAVWTPGSYLIREFSKSVEGFSAQNGSGQALKYEKTKKNTWRVFAENTKSITISYRVYAFEASVRTSIADASHGYINPTSVCMFVPQLSQNPLTVKIVPFKDWKNISTGLEPAGADKFTLKADNYDMLADCPIEVGNHKVLIFRADGGTQYEMAMYGDANYNETQLIADMKTVVEETGKVVGENPNKRYVFLVHHYTNGSGGLEHKNSTTLDVSRNTYQANYAGFLSLVAHEYFHLWNVKRIRAKALGPFDYENENYTHLLWVAEGFTTYYQNLILRRAGIITADSFVTITNNNIGTIENQPGNAVQSLAESSFDAWIKYYRTNENSNNTTVSYYTKGAVVGCLLDLEIINATNGEKNLDDVFKFLYNEYFKKQQRGFTDEEMQQAVEKVAGKSMKDFFENHISDTKTIDYNRIFGYAGFRMSQVPVSNGEGYLGANFNLTNGKLLVTSTLRGASAYTYGLNVNDEILAADGLRINSAEELNRLAESKRAGEKISLLISRDNLIKTLEITLGKSPQVRYKLEKLNNLTEKQQKIQQKWLRL